MAYFAKRGEIPVALCLAPQGPWEWRESPDLSLDDGLLSSQVEPHSRPWVLPELGENQAVGEAMGVNLGERLAPVPAWPSPHSFCLWFQLLIGIPPPV